MKDAEADERVDWVSDPKRARRHGSAYVQLEIAAREE
jgi:hypothetical protein